MPSNFGHREARAANLLDLTQQGELWVTAAVIPSNALRADATLLGPWRISSSPLVVACGPSNMIGSLVSVEASSHVFVTANVINCFDHGK